MNLDNIVIVRGITYWWNSVICIWIWVVKDIEPFHNLWLECLKRKSLLLLFFFFLYFSDILAFTHIWDPMPFALSDICFQARHTVAYPQQFVDSDNGAFVVWAVVPQLIFMKALSAGTYPRCPRTMCVWWINSLDCYSPCVMGRSQSDNS